MEAMALARPACADSVPASAAEPPLAGWHDGLFYVRDASDNFRLYVQGRVHVDALTALGPGIGSLGADSAITSRFTLRRVRPELSGEFFKRWQWQLSVDLAPSAIDNPAGQLDQPTCTIDAKTGAQSCTERANGVEAAAARPAPTDAFVNFVVAEGFNVQVGQYLIPFTFENRMSDNTTPYLERSLAVRAVGAPTQRDIGAMLWGELGHRGHGALLSYYAGIFDGDGPNRFNVDSRFDGIGRVVVKPFAAVSLAGLDTALLAPLRDAQVGVSGRYGSRDPHLVGYDMYPLTTAGGFAFWKPTYKDSLGRTLHILPSAVQTGLAFDAYVPLGHFDLTGEAVYIDDHTREAVDGYQLSPFTERTGALQGTTGYVSVGYWFLGDRSLIGFPSSGKPNHLDLHTVGEGPSHGLEVLLKGEDLVLTYDGASRGGSLDPKTPDGRIHVLSATAGANYWATKHVRVSVNYSVYDFPGSEPVTASSSGGPTQTSAQRAIAPAQNLIAGADDAARNGGHVLHELAMRVGIQF